MNLFLLLVVVLVLVHFTCGLKVQESSTLRYHNTDIDHSIMNVEIFTKPGCESKCGDDLKVPYPFGIGLNCSIDPSFSITCNKATNPPKAFIKTGNIQIHDITNTQLRTSNFLAQRCYESGEILEDSYVSYNLTGTTFTYSEANVFTVVGCDDYVYIYKNASEGALPKGCISTCDNTNEVRENVCSGSGCCQVSIDVQQYFVLYLHSYYNHTNFSSSDNCGYAFLSEKNRFKFGGKSDLSDPTFKNRTKANVPVVLDWVIGNKSCSEAVKDSDSYACKYPNSECINGNSTKGGYRCSCLKGYEGNPYLSPTGCKDIDECKTNPQICGKRNCKNTLGSYDCPCPGGYRILGGNDCIRKSQQIKIILGMGFSCLFIIIGMHWLYSIMRRRKHSQLRDKFFQQNGGLFLLRQKSISEGASSIESTKHYTDVELKKATNNYTADMILGQGGYGIVYKGILPDQRVVAIKRSKVMDRSQIHQFINEVLILTQINHRNVVKLLGCCLECEVPLLVYEFVSNGTLYHHVHNIDGGASWLSLANRLRIAAESSGALAYLHSAASIPIIHRDVKLGNILLDDHHVAKIADFGASRLVPMDQTEVTTLVQGTLGYLDPEYFHTGTLTDKSDVYSFGVVLAELLTRRKPIGMANIPQEERNLATYFITSLKENRLFQILDPRVVREGTLDQLQKAAELVKRCLNLSGEERPTMKEVTMEIESLRKYTSHPWADQHNEESRSLISHIKHSDLYEIELSSYNDGGNDSEQYNSLSGISLLHSSNKPC